MEASVTSAHRAQRLSRQVVLLAAGVVTYSVLAGCGGGDSGGSDAEGTYVHDEEGTIVLESDGSGSITQSSDAVTFQWDRDGETITLTMDFDTSRQAVATLDADGDLVFRAGDFSGDEPETFTRQD